MPRPQRIKELQAKPSASANKPQLKDLTITGYALLAAESLSV